MPTPAKPLRILAVSGSLRAASLHTLLLQTLATLAPASIEVQHYRHLGDLPLFNPDLETPLPEPVADFKNHVLSADAVVIASPEYAHGVTGVIKNALDWLVGTEAFVNKPIVLLNASGRAVHAYAALREIITMMSANIIDAASLTIPLYGNGLTERMYWLIRKPCRIYKRYWWRCSRQFQVSLWRLKMKSDSRVGRWFCPPKFLDGIGCPVVHKVCCCVQRRC
jgi:NAD(P)H-dependent FMN reductase